MVGPAHDASTRPFFSASRGSALAGAAHAQQRGQSRDDLLDALTRHIQICGEITDTQARLACYDRCRPRSAACRRRRRPTPTPLHVQPPRRRRSHAAAATGAAIGSSGGSSISPRRSRRQPLSVPGGGTATLGGGRRCTSAAARAGAQRSRRRLRSAQPSDLPAAGGAAAPSRSRRCAAPVRGRCPTSSTPQPLVTSAPPT